jgi:hypothetical protein
MQSLLLLVVALLFFSFLNSLFIVIKCVGVASFLSVSDINVFDIRMNTFDVLSQKMIDRCYNYKAFMACAFGL